ncbi:MAG: hypothetical protein A2855_02715 [Candidatus Liptonbacteria bacterium RIFCSPHIGHO2_01_FULL_57_28]|uniref:Peptidase M10 metallopeptidase domain-containing protein n=1 Tax=Candidatus Liptonbacteria bacterium RIFCSPHIGHO2_01_FULL_57_28 TaxID=1798647 RepID=A0A1G2CD96_9BACT|nr:MAG: hypothetical protein A2855_02715 [Candidatus Liptonbacteria bacterium RIFCSPHIGHO2_01_FULL_57_28]
MTKLNRRRLFAVIMTLFAVGALASVAYANHSWGGYHWARTSNPFTLKLGDNVTSAWDAYLAGASADWSQSNVLDTTIVAGGVKSPKNCRPTAGRIEVCNAKYGNNGWLGLAQIWITGGVHISQGIAKMNDTYFNTSQYNTPAWRRLVMCQEVAHAFGLDHQDENFNNPNLGSCMDYTGDPDGPLSNEHPNAHDFEQLGIIYAHLDTTTTVGAGVAPRNGKANLDNPTEWGQVVRQDARGRSSLYERDLGGGRKVVTFVFWAD